MSLNPVTSIILFDSLLDLLNLTKSDYITICINNNTSIRITNDNGNNHPLGIVNIHPEKINIISYDLSADQFTNRCFIFSNVRFLRMNYNKDSCIYQLERVSSNDEESIIDLYNSYSHKFIDISKKISEGESTAIESITSGMDINSLNSMIINNHSNDTSIVYVDSQSSETIKDQDTYFKFTNINLKSKESIREGYEMDDFYDTSFYLSKVYQQSKCGCSLLTQLKMQFLIFLNTLNTPACGNMHNIIKLFTKSKDDSLVLNILEHQSMNLNSLYLLLLTMWEFMSWEMKLYFVDTTTWFDLINKIDVDLINMKVTDDERYIKYYNYMSEKIRRQLKSVAKEDDSGFLSDVKDLVYDFEPIDLDLDVSDDAEMDPLYTEEQEYVEIYGSSEDEYAPAVASKITYKRG